jgi:ArsR family transcriptional regulator
VAQEEGERLVLCYCFCWVIRCFAKWLITCRQKSDMNGRALARFDARARVFKALAHPSRLCLVEALARGERCVGELTELVGAGMPTVSKHLWVLRAAGIVADEKRGMQVYYRLKMPCVMRFFDCVGEVMARTAEEQADLALVAEREAE